MRVEFAVPEGHAGRDAKETKESGLVRRFRESSVCGPGRGGPRESQTERKTQAGRLGAKPSTLTKRRRPERLGAEQSRERGGQRMQEAGPERSVQAVGPASHNVVGGLGAGVGGSGEGRPDGRRRRRGWTTGMEMAFRKTLGRDGARGRRTGREEAAALFLRWKRLVTCVYIEREERCWTRAHGNYRKERSRLFCKVSKNKVGVKSECNGM